MSELQGQIKPHHINRLKILGIALTLLGVAVFGYFVYSVGLDELIAGIVKFGLPGFAVILLLYGLRIAVRAMAWRLSVAEPHWLRFKDAFAAVIIGEAMSSMLPLGILISGTAKAVAVRKRMPLVVGLSSVATENLFYSLITSIFLILGALTFLRSYALEEGWIVIIDALIAAIIALILFIIVMIVRQWHFASYICEWLYEKGWFPTLLARGRIEVRVFEDLIYGFYRSYPQRFLPICIFEILYHLCGVAEVWFILSRISDEPPSLLTAFLLESVSRLITIVFKLIPFVIGVDEAGAEFVGDTVALASGVGVTIAIIRKGRILFWTFIGLLLIIRRGLSIRQFQDAAENAVSSKRPE